MGRDVYAGVMSGTSLDGIDAVVADFSPAQGLCRTLGAAHVAMPDLLRKTLLDLQTRGDDELARAAQASVELADLYADSVIGAARSAGIALHDVLAAGVHGQTVRHRPDAGWTIQLNDPARISERLVVAVVADFRRRDLAAGGQGAPLVPAFHQALFARDDRARAVLNLGGIANLTLLTPGAPVRGFDTGPGNVLLDAWHARHRAGALDAGGEWAATGHVDDRLLAVLMGETYFRAPPPKSTGRDVFHMGWLEQALARHGATVASVDVQATLVRLTVQTVVEALRREMPRIDDMLVCGGGARNATLMSALAAELDACTVVPTSAEGVAIDQVEALAFAWLARETLAGRPGNVPAVTGARGLRVLGGIYPK